MYSKAWKEKRKSSGCQRVLRGLQVLELRWKHSREFGFSTCNRISCTFYCLHSRRCKNLLTSEGCIHRSTSCNWRRRLVVAARCRSCISLMALIGLSPCLPSCLCAIVPDHDDNRTLELTAAGQQTSSVLAAWSSLELATSQAKRQVKNAPLS